MVEQSLEETDSGLVEAAQSFGASTWQIVWKVYLKETLPSLVRGAAITFVTLFGYSAMAGTVGAGGLGDIAIRYGYQRFQTDVMILRRAFVRRARHRVPSDRRCDRAQDRQAPQVEERERGVLRDVVDHAKMGSRETLEHAAEPTLARNAGQTPQT